MADHGEGGSIVRPGMVRAVVCAAILLWAARASAQLFDGAHFHPGTLAEASEEAKKSYRLHLIFLDSENPELREAKERLLRGRSMNQWIHWHAVFSRVSATEDPALFERLSRGLRQSGWDPSEHLTILVLRGDRRVLTLPWFPHSDTRPDAPSFMRNGGDFKNLELKPLEVLLQCQILLDKWAATDPVWTEWHNHKNPPPPAPPRVWFSTIADENAPACEGPGDGEDALSMLERARAQAASGALADATASYTWVWEHLEDGRPWLRPLRRTVVAAEMMDLAKRRAGTRARFAAMRDETANREPWEELDERLDRFILDEVVDAFDSTLMELDYVLNDTDESSLLTRSESAGLRAMIAGMPWLDIWTVTSADIARVTTLDRAAGDKRPSLATEEEWSHVRTLRRSIARSEACRIHAASLKSGDADGAMRIATNLLREDTDGTGRLALAAVAWGAGVADERHAAWVQEARALGADDAGLGALLGTPSEPSDGDGGTSRQP